MSAMKEMNLFLKYLQNKTWSAPDIFQYILNFCSRSEIRDSKAILLNYPIFSSLIEILDQIKSEFMPWGIDVEVNKRQLIELILEKIYDLFDCIAQGYYAKDSLTYLKNIVDLLQIIYDIMNNSVYIACYELENSNTDIPNPQASFNQLLEIYVQDSLELKMDGERLYINFNVRGSREEQFDFKLNLKKVIEEKAHKQAFFIDHLKEYYYSYDLILEKITEKK